MGIFSFMSKNGKGCFAAIGKDGLSYVVRKITASLRSFSYFKFTYASPDTISLPFLSQSLNLKRQCVNVHANLVCKKWHFICISHSIGRAFWGGSLLRCYVDGDLVSSARCR